MSLRDPAQVLAIKALVLIVAAIALLAMIRCSA